MFVLQLTYSVAQSHHVRRVILHVIVSSAVAFPRQFRSFPQAADDEQCQYGKSDNAGDDRYDHRFRSNWKRP